MIRLQRKHEARVFSPLCSTQPSASCQHQNLKGPVLISCSVGFVRVKLHVKKQCDYGLRGGGGGGGKTLTSYIDTIFFLPRIL